MKFDDQVTSRAGGFQFSHVRTEALGAPEYTLVTLVLDKTGSVSPFADTLFKIKSTVVEACRRSPRADYLLLRVVEFNSRVDEVHGFELLANIKPSDYVTPKCGGMTALRDAAFSAVASTRAFAKTLADQDYLVNGIIAIVTDGDDNESQTTVAELKQELQAALTSESLESLRTVLVGVNAGDTSQLLNSFKDEVGIDQYVDVADASPQRLAKLFDFVSKSISAQSQALGTGGPSQALTF